MIIKTKKYSLALLSAFLILLVFISSASAVDANETDILAVDGPTNTVDEKLALDYSSEVSAVANDSNVIENDEEITTWYVNGSKTSSGNGTSDAEAFMSLKEAIDNSINGDTIMIASGEYKGTDNVGLTINNNLNFIKYGDDEAIFDAESLSRIWTVTATSINITGLTFKNGKSSDDGGAILFDNTVISNSNINATFINNTATKSGGAIATTKQQYGLMNNVNISGKFIGNTATTYYGGAIYLYIPVSNSNINASFINNTAKTGGANMFWYNLTNVDITGEFINNSATDSGWESGGGANYFQNKLNNVIISGNFIHNTAYGTDTKDGGGANYFVKELTDVTITGNYINNTAANKGGALYITKVGGNTFIEDACFINNGGDAIYVNDGGINTYHNWFGNNATNYDEAPADAGIKLYDWLFLNATADPSELEIDGSSKITFKLFSYDGNTVSDYTGPIDIQLDLTQTLGELDKEAASLGEEITYTAKQSGDAGVTAAFETASYTISLTNARTPTEIIIANDTLDLKVNDEIPTGATLTPADAGNLTYTSSNSSVAIVENGKIKALKEGNAIITVSFEGNEQYAPAVNKTIEVTVTLRDANWTFINMISGKEEELDGAFLYLPLNYYPDCFVKDADGIALPAGTNVTIFCEGKDNYTLNSITQENGLFNVDVSDVKPDQTYSVTFSTEGYTTATATIRVIKAPTEINVANDTIEMKVKDEVDTGATLTPADAGNLTYTSSNSSIATVENGKIKALGEGNAVITVSFAGDDTYAAAANKTISVTVTLNDASVNVENTTIELNVGETSAIIATTTPEGLDVTYIPDESGIISVDENGIITALKEGTASIIVKVGGDGVYTENSTTVTVTVTKVPTAIDAVYNNKSGELIANLANNITGQPIKGAYVVIKLAGETYKVKTNSAGQATLSTADIAPGSYVATVSYKGNLMYESSSATADVAFMGYADITAVYDETTKELTVTLVNNETGAAVKGASVVVKVDGKTYKAKIDANGEGTVSLANLTPGEYTATVAYKGGAKYYAANTTADVIITGNSTISAAYDDETKELIATLTDNTTGKALEGFEIIISIDGEKYTVETDANGEAKLSTEKLAPGTYPTIVSFEGSPVYNPSSIDLEVIVKYDVAITAVYSEETNEIVVSLTNNDTGAPIKGANVVIKVNGKTYKVKINSKGEGVLSLADVDPGSYEVSVSYKGSTLYNAAETTVDVAFMGYANITAAYDDSTKDLTVTLVNNATGIAVKGANVVIKVDSKTYKVKIDATGKGKLSLADLTPGSYDASITYKGGAKYYPASTTAEIVVKK